MNGYHPARRPTQRTAGDQPKNWRAPTQTLSGHCVLAPCLSFAFCLPVKGFSDSVPARVLLANMLTAFLFLVSWTSCGLVMVSEGPLHASFCPPSPGPCLCGRDLPSGRSSSGDIKVRGGKGVGSGENVVGQSHYQPILLGRRRVGGGEQAFAHHLFFVTCLNMALATL